MRVRSLWLTTILFATPAIAGADSYPLDKVPDQLKPWVQWVLDGHEETRCPGLSNGQRPCFWPGRLSLDLSDKQGRFQQHWQVFRQGWVPLPGDAKRWPQSVSVDGVPAATVLVEGSPRVKLTPGSHSVSGELRWDSLPELLDIPRETGLVELVIRGKRNGFPNRDAEGRLWVQKATQNPRGESRLEIVVHRRVIDEIPLMLVTDLELKVSGKNREVLLGTLLPPDFIATSLTGPLPARLEKDGRLRVQARPGDWRLSLTARHVGPVSQLSMPPKSEKEAPSWDKEVWVFDARPDLRLVSVEGVPSVDPQQTELLYDWKQLPAYLMRRNDSLKLVEKRRGDAEPAPDQLNLQRQWWLDFDGGGFSVRDQISGTLRRAWRMEVAEPTKLGRVAVGGSDQFITAIAPKAGQPKAVGIEIRQGTVQLDADSRVPREWSVPAVGWSNDFHHVSGTLHLPPGWRIIHASGVDEAFPTWITRWTLLDLFILMMIALATGKLWGPRWGALALVALALCYHEPGAPRWTWIFLLALEALARVLPEGKLLAASRTGRLGLQLLLAVFAIPFLVSQVRVAVYPQLENAGYSGGRWGGGGLYQQNMGMVAGAAGNVNGMDAMQAAVLEEPKSDEDQAERNENGPVAMSAPAPMMKARKDLRRVAGVRGGMSLSYSRAKMGQDLNLYAPDIKAQVSTGPGMPDWNWSSVSLNWRGPVEHNQRMKLFLIGPSGNLALALLRCALLVLLAVCMMGFGEKVIVPSFSTTPPRGPMPYALLLALLFGASSARAEMPTQDLLRDLQTRLLRAADCEPQCGSISRLRLEATADILRARLETAAGAAAGIALPGGIQQWTPSRVLIDGAEAKGLWRGPDGVLYAPVGAGSHQILLEGPLPEREIVQLPLPLKPHRVEVQASGWTVEGLREDGTTDENLQLTRVRTAGSKSSDVLQPGSLPPFVQIERELKLGLSWQIETRVTRLTPIGEAVVLEVPLLPGESITSADIRAENGKAKLSLAPQVSQIEWSSVLSQAESLKLQAPDSVPWTEVWRLEAGPIWHVDAGGIPVVHSEDNSGARIREWRPWPGESVTLSITRPEGVPGQTVTIDQSRLSVSPGLRATDASLDLTIRTSRGGQQSLTLPEGAELQSITMDGRREPVRQEKRTVTLSLLPGSHQFSLAWRQTGGVSLLTRTPEIGLGLASVNSRISVTVPNDRWILAVGGPRLGPAVLFWSALAVMLLVSFGLSRLGLAPLGTGEWFLLTVGLSQIPMPYAALMAGWLLALGVRRKAALEVPWRFNLSQVLLALWTVAALVCLYSAIRRGLLGQPEMQISGNGSSAFFLQWYQDRAAETLPKPWFFSLPRMVYRLLMLGWALWIASALIAWLRWGWECMNEGGLWKPNKK